ncbi:hypothetical protein [Amycolatopsis sp. NPDC051716]|jgi:hypothetical protein|uniref:hypothetical protein n=1 Tax=Amycolatopsis sp. NPDC051716 TaxID=3155804 RepID=UPI003442389B
MPARTAWATATLVVCGFATIGVLGTPAGVLAGLCLLGTAIGALAAVLAPHVRRAAPGRPRTANPRAGALAAGIFFALSFTVSGMLASLGSWLTASLVVVLASVVLVAGPRRKAVRSGTGTRAAATPPPAARTVAELSTDELCAAWRRSYCRLLVTHDLLARRYLVQRRQDYLDELERRDRSGFLRWLADGAGAGSDPGPYLTTRR